jgi:hypothetical protein
MTHDTGHLSQSSNTANAQHVVQQLSRSKQPSKPSARRHLVHNRVEPKDAPHDHAACPQPPGTCPLHCRGWSSLMPCCPGPARHEPPCRPSPATHRGHAGITASPTGAHGAQHRKAPPAPPGCPFELTATGRPCSASRTAPIPTRTRAASSRITAWPRLGPAPARP